MKLSRDRVLHISHLILDYLNKEDRVEFFADPQEIRQDMLRIITEDLRADEAIDAAVRRKIESQRRPISEGSDEWDVLYRKYYEEESARHHRALP